MNNTILILAEVSGKMMSFPIHLICCMGLFIFSALLIRKSVWLVIIPLPIALLFALGSWTQLTSPHFGPTVINELDYHYLTLGVFPLFSIVLLLSHAYLSRTKHSI